MDVCVCVSRESFPFWDLILLSFCPLLLLLSSPMLSYAPLSSPLFSSPLLSSLLN